MIKELEKELIEKKDNREINRVLEWVNSRALDLFEKSLYEGGDKQKSNKSNKKRNNIFIICITITITTVICIIIIINPFFNIVFF